MVKIAVLVDYDSQGGSGYVKKQISSRLMQLYGDSIRIVYKTNDWNQINVTLKELKSENIKLIFDLNYWPINYYQVKSLKHNLKAITKLPYLLGESYYYAKKLKVKSAVLLQGMGLNALKFGLPYILIKYLKMKSELPIDIFLNTKNKFIYTVYKGLRESFISSFIKYSNAIHRIYGVSQGQLSSLGLAKSKKATVIDPPLAVEKELLSKRKDVNEKKDYLVFYARLIPLKGILELPFIVKEVITLSGYKELKVFIMGKFPVVDLKNFFFSIVNKLSLEENIVYKGYVSREELLNTVSEARCVVYPSHEDSFSLAILEAITMGTPVVAYDIPGPKSVYSGLSSVKFVDEFNIKSMATEVVKILKMTDDEYNSLIYNDKMDKFIEKYTDWDLVVERYYRDLMSLL